MRCVQNVTLAPGGAYLVTLATQRALLTVIAKGYATVTSALLVRVALALFTPRSAKFARQILTVTQIRIANTAWKTVTARGR